MDYYKDNENIAEANKIINMNREKKIAEDSFNKGMQEGVYRGEQYTIEDITNLANMQAAYERVQRTPPGMNPDPSDLALASDFLILSKRAMQRPPSTGGLGGKKMNSAAQEYMLNKIHAGEMVHNQSSQELKQIQKAPKAKATPTTIEAMRIAKEAMEIGRE